MTDIGHNRPPLISRSQLAIDHANIPATIGKLAAIVAGLPPSIDDDETCGTWQDAIKDIGAQIKNIEAARVAEKEPFLAGGRIVDGFFGDLTKQCMALNSQVARVVQDYLTAKARATRIALREQERQAQEEAARQRAEAEDRQQAAMVASEENRLKQAAKHREASAAADFRANAAEAEAIEAAKAAQAKSAEHARTRSAAGSLGTLSDSWDFAIENINELKGASLWPFITQKAKEDAIRQWMRVNLPKSDPPEGWQQPMPGVKFYRVSKLTVR